MLSAGGLVPGQRKNEERLPPRWDSPPEVKILKHRFGASKKFVSETTPNPSNPTGEPSSRLRTKVKPAVYLELKNQTTKKIIGMIWYFVLHKSENEEFFRVRFVNTTVIEAGKSRALTGEMDRMPRPPQTVSVDELNTPRRPAQERIVISCIMFADGSFSSLNEFTKEDCESLKPIQSSRSRSAPHPPTKRRVKIEHPTPNLVTAHSRQMAAKITAR